MNFKVALAAAAAICALGAASANAAVIYSNFGPGRSFDPFTGWAVAGPGTFFGEISPGMAFTSAASADVSQIDIALSRFSGDGSGDVSLWTRDFATMLGSWHLTGLPSFGPFGGAAVTISGISGVHLSAATDYVMVATASLNNFDAWSWNNTGATGDKEHNQGAYTTDTLGAFDVLSGGVPEPAIWAMMLAGFSGIGAVLRRRRAQPATATA